MCFSANASFTASVLLAFIAILAIKKSRHNQALTLFAATPLIFSAQQACEGIIWLSAAANPAGLAHTLATYSFLFCAYLLWPVWIPVITWLIERTKTGNSWRTQICLASVGAGLIFDLYTATQIIKFGVWSKIVDQHIVYPSYGTGDNWSLTAMLYLCALLTPLLVSSMRYTTILAASIAGSLALTTFWYPAHIVSIWCFCAAIISSLILYIVDNEKSKKLLTLLLLLSITNTSYSAQALKPDLRQVVKLHFLAPTTLESHTRWIPSLILDFDSGTYTKQQIEEKIFKQTRDIFNPKLVLFHTKNIIDAHVSKGGQVIEASARPS